MRSCGGAAEGAVPFPETGSLALPAQLLSTALPSCNRGQVNSGLKPNLKGVYPAPERAIYVTTLSQDAFHQPANDTCLDIRHAQDLLQMRSPTRMFC